MRAAPASTDAPGRSLGELAELVGAELRGDVGRRVSGVASLEDAGPDEVAFFHNARYRDALAATRAGAVVLSPGDARTAARLPALLLSDNPYLAFAKLSALFHPTPPTRPGRHPQAFVEPSANVDPLAQIGPLAYVGEDAVVGARTVLGAGAVVERGARVGTDCLLHARSVVREGCVLGDRVILQPGAVVGSDGFGYAFDPAGPAHRKVPQAGIARLEDDVELGANACVDRATLGETVVGRGTKIDNLVQVAHNVRIGPLSILCAQAGIAGSSRLGAGVMLGGQAGLSGHIELGDGAKVGAQGGVMADIPAGEAYTGYPALPHRGWLKSSALFARLPELFKRLEALERRAHAGAERVEPGSNGSASGS